MAEGLLEWFPKKKRGYLNDSIIAKKVHVWFSGEDESQKVQSMVYC